MLKKQVTLGRTLLCVVLCVIFTALTTYQFSYHYAFSRYRSELAGHVITINDKDYLLGVKDTEIATLKASLATANEKVSTLTNRLVALAGKEDATAEECLRHLLREALVRRYDETGVGREYLDEEIDAYMNAYAADYMGVAERLLFVDYLYRTQYFQETPGADVMQEVILEAYIAAAGDMYANYYTPEEYEAYRGQMTASVCGIGAVTLASADGASIIVLHTHKGSPAALAGLQKEDEIVTVNGTSVATLGYTAALAALMGDAGTDVTFTYRRDGRAYTLTVTRAQIEPEVVMGQTLTENGKKIGYIRITSFNAATAAQLDTVYTALQGEGIEAVVFDLRDNTGGLLTSILEVMEYILPAGCPVVRYEFGNPHRQIEPSYTEHADCIDLPMYVLQNGKTASAAELFCAALQLNGAAELIGETTYGKGQMQTGYRLADGSYITVTVARYAPADGEHYDGVGVTPDHRAATAEGYENTLIYLLPMDRDAQLMYALALAAA